MLNKRMCYLPANLIGAQGTAQLVRGSTNILRLSLRVIDAIAHAVVSETEHHREGQIFTRCADGVLVLVPLRLDCVCEHLRIYDQHQRELQSEE